MRYPFIILLLFGFGISLIKAQTASTSDNLVAQPVPQRTVSFNLSEPGISTPIIWGLDLAWLSRENIQRGIAFMGAELVDVIRSSFTPTAPLVDGKLQTTELSRLNQRLNIINLLDSHTKVVLNCDHPSVDPWFSGNAANWAELIDVTAKHHEDKGRTVVSVSPFNEPDYGWGQGSVTDFYNIAGELKKNPRFDNIRICGGNTLNTDQALNWYNQLKSRLDEGNTHQLAGSFDNYANFHKTVRANGHHATNDELHNVMEAMVGVEYGMQTGIWWGTAEYARGEFVKASHGTRLGYAEHRPNWTAASVYRAPDGKVQAFGGTSERQAVTTTYRFVSKDRDVFYDGNGPQREYTLVMPGGTGYQNGQTNAEKVVSITWGDDIQPVINGRYVVVNRNSGMVMEVENGSSTAGANVRQNDNAGATYQQWNVTPVDSRIGGDFSYFTFTAVNSGLSLDILNWSLSNGGNIIAWSDAKGGNQQFYLEYAEDGWFYIRSRHSSHCIEVVKSSTTRGANIQQGTKTGGTNQQWRFLPVGTTIEFNPPSAANDLVATANTVSVQLDWSASPETDVSGYTIFRSESAEGSYNTIARNVKSTSFVDNTVIAGIPYFYKIKAIDNALNRSDYSNEVSATATGDKSLVAHLPFDGSAKDSTIHLNHSASSGNVSFVNGKVGTKAISLNSVNGFVQLPAYTANHQEMSIAMWVYWRGGSAWQRLFDFGNGESEYMFLTPRSGDGKLRFAIKNGSEEQQLNATSALPISKWSHVSVTLGTDGAHMYVNGVLVAESSDINIRPIDFKPILNYIGRSQFSDPLLYGYVDDFRIYNYALTASEVTQLSENLSSIEDTRTVKESILSVWPVPANDVLHVNYSATNNNSTTTLNLYTMDGRLVMSKNLEYPYDTEFNVSAMSAGIYILKLVNGEETVMKKVLIRHD